MFRMVEERDVLEIQSVMTVGQRGLFLLLALFPLLAPYQLIMRPEWDSYLNVFFVFVLVISAGAMAVSAFLVWAAVAGLDSNVRFDKTDDTLTYAEGAPIIRWRSQRHSIRGISGLQVEKHDWSDGAPGYVLLVQMADGSSFRTGSSWSRKEIEAMVQRVSAFLGLTARP